MRLSVRTNMIETRRRGGFTFGLRPIEVDASDEAAKAIIEDPHLLAKVLDAPVEALPPSDDPPPPPPPPPEPEPLPHVEAEAPPVEPKKKK